MNRIIEELRPDSLQVVGRYTSLRKVGKEYIGLSPCHNDRHPSLRVNVDKQLWYCDPCASGGDAIRFIQVAEHVSFKKALSILGITDKAKPRLPVSAAQHRAAEAAAAWMADERRKINVLLSEITQELKNKIEFIDALNAARERDGFSRDLSIPGCYLVEACCDNPDCYGWDFSATIQLTLKHIPPSLRCPFCSEIPRLIEVSTLEEHLTASGFKRVRDISEQG